MAERKQTGAKVKMAPPNYDGLPVTVLTQRITELDASIAVIHKLRGNEDREDWEEAAAGTLKYDEAMVLIQELTADRQRYIDALSKTARRSELFSKGD